eukprot:m51a1_g8666 hypothetical protein (238) ;mRNA; r:98945-99865
MDSGVVTNVYILRDPCEGLTLIDPGLPCDAEAILEGVRHVSTLGAGDDGGNRNSAGAERAPLQLRRILITHADQDHIGSLAAVKRAHPAAEVLSSAAVSPGIEQGYLPGREPKDPQVLSELMEHIKTHPLVQVEGLPGGATRKIAGGDVIPGVPGGLRVIDSAGHTPGHLSFYAEGVAGGTLFPGDSCWVSEDAAEVIVPPRLYNWDQAMTEQCTRTQIAMGASVICPAHGPVWHRK